MSRRPEQAQRSSGERVLTDGLPELRKLVPAYKATLKTEYDQR
jgi:hypothetical protein